MKQLMAAVAAGLVVAAAGTAQPGAAAKSIDGTYKVTFASFGGKPDDEKVGKATFVFQDGTITIKGDGDRKEDTAEYTLDPSKTPARIDIIPDNRGGKAELIKGIYQTKTTAGVTELTISFTKDGSDRPTDFKGEGKGTVLIKLVSKGGK